MDGTRTRNEAVALDEPTDGRDVIVSLFKHIDDRDWPGLSVMLSEDVAYERPGYDRFVGRDRVMQFYREERIIASGVHELEHVVVHGTSAACRGRFRGVDKSGRPIDLRFAEWYEFDHGLIKARASYFFMPSV